MSQPNDTTQTAAPEQDAAPTETPNTELSNRDVKDSPLFQKLAAKLGAYEAQEAERLEKEANATKQAEQDRLAAEGNYKAALELKDAEYKQAQETFNKQILERDLKTELYKQGFDNDMFIAGAVNSFNGEAGNISEFVTGLASNDANKMFLNNANARTPLPPTGNTNVTGNTVDIAKVRELTKSNDPNVRKSAQQAIADYWDKNGAVPPR